MYKKCISLILILVITMAFFSAGCSENKEAEKTEKIGKAQNTSEKILKIFYFEHYNNINASALSEFKKIHNDIKIEERVVRMQEFDSFEMKFRAELLAGEGADIISLPSFLFPDRLMERGILCDLDLLIPKDENFKIGNYNEKVMNVGVYNGKRYIVPLDYSFDYLFTYKTLLSNVKLNTTNWTWDNLANNVKEYYKEGKGASKYFFSSNFSIWNIISSSGNSYVDYEKKTSNFNSPEFIKLLQIYKNLVPYICPQEEGNETDIEKRLKISVLHSSTCNGITDSTGFSANNKPFGEDAIILPYPTINGEKHINVFASELVAITTKCKYKEEASDFIKIILSEENQANETIAVPVMDSVFNKQIEYIKNNEKVGSQISDLFQNIAGCTLSDGNVSSILNKELPDFISGKKSAEQTAKAIDEKVTLYLNE